MRTDKRTADVKVRVTVATKEQLEALAGSRQLDVADIVREALREYLGRESERMELAAIVQREAVAS
jgi:predicted DNA-binding protein